MMSGSSFKTRLAYWLSVGLLVAIAVGLTISNGSLRDEAERLRSATEASRVGAVPPAHDDRDRGPKVIDPDAITSAELGHLVVGSAPPAGADATPDPVRENVLLALAKRDPARAADLALDEGARGALVIALRNWGEQNPDAALGWFRHEEKVGTFEAIERAGTGSGDVFAALLSGIARNRPRHALEILGGMESESFFRGATQSLDEAGIADLSAALLESDQSRLRNAGLRTIAATLGQTARLEEASELLQQTSSGLPPDEHDRVALAFIRKVRIEEVENRGELADWVAAAAPERQRPQEMRSFVGKWARVDLNGAALWLREQQPSPWRDMAVYDFAARARDADPISAEQWARSISDRGLREQALRRLRER